ncbi:phosphoglycolate phosphatase 1B, chloroplastic-like [Sitophilus oryzae]|uniref:Phosphoglycolate phosphatase 1B, chloroplastic-like n=1 Tax=Sitophilus oryzae TaxID=7048 RepID=A0A6J2XRJ1_SITOR|nr:phosphoglycolate phosphatase 1B, chloroplastic-like [Sitophilus oryzae]
MSSFKYLSEISENELKKLIQSIDTVFFDVDGVLTLSTTPIPGAKECVAKLRKLGKRIGFVTNNTFSSVELLMKTLDHCEPKEDEINTPNTVVVSFLKDINFNKDIYLIGSTLLRSMLIEAGFSVVRFEDLNNELKGENYGHLLELIEETVASCKNVGAMVLCFDFNFNHLASQIATSILQHYPDVLLLSGLTDDIGPLTKKFTAVGSKYYIDGIQRWTNRQCIQMAKPGLAFKDVLISKYGITDPSRVLFIGDNLASDIAFAKNGPFKTILVLSGVTSKSDVENPELSDDKKPDYVADSLAELYKRIAQY